MKTGGIQSRFPALWRGVGALVLGVLLARWGWVFFVPQATAVAIVPEHGNSIEAGRLFGVAVATAQPAEAMVLPNVRLVGVFATQFRNHPRDTSHPELPVTGAGHPGFAVLKLDEKRQVGVAVGESVVPGTKLLEVHPDYVLLERAGVRQRVNLEGKVAGAAGDAVR